jgi:hypothetical protein
MIKRVCDICGAEVKHGFIDNGGYDLFSETFKIKIYDSGIKKLDICNKCANKIRKICKMETIKESEG